MSEMNYEINKMPLDSGILSNKKNVIVSESGFVLLSENGYTYIKRSDDIYIELSDNINIKNVNTVTIDNACTVEMSESPEIYIKGENVRINDVLYEIDKTGGLKRVEE